MPLTRPLKITAICPVYGRVSRLREALACFLRQTYEHKEMVILNSFPRQTLTTNLEIPGVKIINLPVRPASLGECRNMAIKEATGDVMVTWDSDDLYRPHYMSLIAQHMSGSDWYRDWIWFNKQFYAEQFRIKEVMQGQMNSVVFTKHAWMQVGRYPNLTVGEDAGFIQKLTKETKGSKIPILPREIGLVYSWGNNTYKTSGFGLDKPGQIKAHDRVENEVNQLIARGQEPVGIINMSPVLEHDPERMAQIFLSARGLLVDKKNAVCIVELGRFGDIVNILPIAKHIHNVYGKPHMMVSREFASVLEGVSYVEPYIVDFDNSHINEAMTLANQQFKHVIQAQIWGKNYFQLKLCGSYNEESWRQAGFWRKFNDCFNTLPDFDKRDKEREQALWNKLNVTDQPMILVNVTKSVSSPLPQGVKLFEAIQALSSDYQVIDLGALRANKIFDIVGLMEKAACLIAIDTAPLHFAAAAGIPTVAIVNPNPWAGTIMRGKSCVARIGYTDALDNPGNVIHFVKKAIETRHSEVYQSALREAPKRRIFHCVERHEESNDPRKHIARRSWDALYNDGVLPCHMWRYPRDARSLGDHRPLPFLKDVIQFGLDQAGDDDIVFFTNDDNFLHADLPGLLNFHCSVYDVCVSRRVEFRDRPMPPNGAPPDEYVKTGEHHIGRDLFAATKRWWLHWWDDIPDAVIGEPLFDLNMAALVRYNFGYKSDRRSLVNENVHPCELPPGYVCHQFHTPRWTTQPGISNGRRRNSDAFKSLVHKYQLPLTFTQQGDI